MRQVEWETLKWIDWYNNRRLLGPIGYIPPAEAEEAFYANLNKLDMVALFLNKSPSGKPGAVHDHKRRLLLRPPPLDAVYHLQANRHLLQCSTSRPSVGRCMW